MKISTRRAVQAAGTAAAFTLLITTAATSAHAMLTPPEPAGAQASAPVACSTHRGPLVMAPRFADKAPEKARPPRKCR